MSFFDGIKEFFGGLAGDAKDQIGEQVGAEDLQANAQDAVQNAGEGAGDVLGQAEEQVNNVNDRMDGKS